MRNIFIAASIAASLLVAAAVHARLDGTERAAVVLRDASNQKVGEATLEESPLGLLLHVTLTRVPAGPHGFHIHAVGKCDSPGFESAGGHFNPDEKQHGYFAANGMHAGDLPNIFVGNDGRLELDVMAPGLSFSTGKRALLDADGASLVLHEGPDDYRTDPAGHAGVRIACGVIKPSS